MISLQNIFSRHAGRTLLASAAALAIAGTASAADVYAVHGINGLDLGAVAELPVDIAINGSCDLTGVEFGDVAGALTVDPGLYEVEVFLDDVEDCDEESLAITGEFDVAVAETAIIVAHLDANGTPKLSKFTAAFSTVPDNRFRFSVAHAAAAPGVTVTLANKDRKNQKATTEEIRNGQQSFAGELRNGTYRATVRAAGSGAKVATLKNLDLADANIVFVAVGALPTATFNIIPVAVDAGIVVPE